MISESIEIEEFPKERLLRALTYTICGKTLPEPWRPDVWSDETETIWNTTNGLIDTATNEFIDMIVADFRPIFFNVQVSEDEYIFDVISVEIAGNPTGHTVRVSLLNPEIEGIKVRYLEILACFQELRRIAMKRALQRAADKDWTSKPMRRGIKLGTSERVNEFHRLVKSGYSHRDAKKRSQCDPSTYYKWCKEVTGEDPIKPYR